MNSMIIGQKEKNYLHTTCNFCKKDMLLAKGSVIVGIKWYHPACFVQVNSHINMANDGLVQCRDGGIAQEIQKPSEGGIN